MIYGERSRRVLERCGSVRANLGDIAPGAGGAIKGLTITAIMITSITTARMAGVGASAAPGLSP